MLQWELETNNKFWVNFFRLTRPLSNVKNIAIIAFASYLSGAKLNWGLFILGALAMSLIFSAIYAYNTVCDADSDKTNKNKRHYSEAAQYFGKNKLFWIKIILAASGLALGLCVNIYFFSSLVALLLIGFLYSSPHTRFRERIFLDVLFGATLTFLFRFVAAWFIFKISFPPLLPMFALVFLKNGGYMLYKEYDRQFLMERGIKNSITVLPKMTVLVISAVFSALSIVLFAILCLFGPLPLGFLWLLPLFAPPILVNYLLFFKKIKISVRRMRAVGFSLLLLLIAIILLMLR